MEKIIVGKIEHHDVLYLPEKDLVYCKNTVFPYKLMEEHLIKSSLDKIKIKEDFVITKHGNSIKLSCLNTTLNNIKNINKNIKKWQKKI